METNIQPSVPIVMSADPAPAPYSNQPSVPIVAKILAVLYYLVSVLLIFAGIIFIFTLSLIGFSGFSLLNPLIGLATGVSGVMSGILILAWGILNFVTGRGLWTGKQWGKFLAITVSALYFIFGIVKVFKFGDSSYITTYASMVINLFIVFYLAASQAIKNAFQPSSKVAIYILPILAIAVYAPIGVMSFQAQTQAQDFVKQIQEGVKNTEQAIQQSGIDCKFYSYDDHSNNKAISTYSGSGIYANSTYNFQINVPMAYTMKELSGVDYCEDDFNFYDPNDTTLGLLMAVTVEPAKGDFNYYFDHVYKYEKDVQQSATQVAGRPAMKFTATYTGLNRVWYLVAYKGAMYTIYNFKGITDDQFNAAVASFQIGNITTTTSGQNTTPQTNINTKTTNQPVTTNPNPQTPPPVNNSNLPDFAVTSLQISPTNLNKNQTGTVTFTIKNTGNVSMNYLQTSGYSINYGNAQPDSSNIVNSTCDMQTPMPPGHECQTTLSVSYSTPGTKTLTIIFDSSNVIQESNESNNQKTITFTVN